MGLEVSGSDSSAADNLQMFLLLVQKSWSVCVFE